jgi:hypothetical protein
MGLSMAEQGPAVSRLCVASTANGTAPLRSVQESAGFYRLQLTTDPADGAEFAVATPGMDEPSLITDLIAALSRRVKTVSDFRRPTVVGFHVGIIKMTGSSFAGIGVERALTLVRDPAISAQVLTRGGEITSAGEESLLTVAITANLFDDLRSEGMPEVGWRYAPTVKAWTRMFGSH